MSRHQHVYPHAGQHETSDTRDIVDADRHGAHAHGNGGSEPQSAAFRRQAPFQHRLFEKDVGDHRAIQNVFHFRESTFGKGEAGDLDDLHVGGLDHHADAQRTSRNDQVLLIGRLHPLRRAGSRGHLVKHSRHHECEHETDAQHRHKPAIHTYLLHRGAT